MRGQTALEYLMLVGAAVLFVTLVVLIIRTNVITPSQTSLNQSVQVLKSNLTAVSGGVVAIDPLSNLVQNPSEAGS